MSDPENDNLRRLTGRPSDSCCLTFISGAETSFKADLVFTILCTAFAGRGAKNLVNRRGVIGGGLLILWLLRGLEVVELGGGSVLTGVGVS